MAGLVRKSFDSPEETRPFEKDTCKLELVNIDSGPVGRATFKPGWQWSKHVKPIAGTDSCQSAHMGYIISGRMKVVMDDGQEDEFGPGDLMICPPGHDAWIVGDEACVVIDWQGVADYAKRPLTDNAPIEPEQRVAGGQQFVLVRRRHAIHQRGICRRRGSSTRACIRLRLNRPVPRRRRRLQQQHPSARLRAGLRITTTSPASGSETIGRPARMVLRYEDADVTPRSK